MALILGAIAALVTIIVFLTGKQSVPELVGTRQIDQQQNVFIPTQPPQRIAEVTIPPTQLMRSTATSYVPKKVSPGVYPVNATLVFVKRKGNHLIVEKGTTFDFEPAP